MAMAGAGARRGRTLLWLLLLSVGFGAIAALIASPSVSTPHPGTYSYAPVPAVLFIDLLAVGVPLLVVVWLARMLLVRTQGTSLPASYALLTFMILVGVIVGILTLGGLLHQSAWPGQESPGAPSNATTPGGGGGGNGTASNGPPNGNLHLHTVAFSPWVWVLLAAVGVGASAIVLATYLSATRANPPSGSEAAKDAVRQEVTDALARLASNTSEDPREVIRALYARLLLRLQPSLAATEVLTAREIERALVERWQVRPAPAEHLTRLFEEARYSHRLLPADAVVTTRAALEEVLEDLRGGRTHVSHEVRFLRPPTR
ncbi:MAG: DUF4129 domain-containing protein [Thermoplasmata archaeon]|nr:DUF4129 domain-containing protein [Thermoplasmata archaeon]